MDFKLLPFLPRLKDTDKETVFKWYDDFENLMCLGKIYDTEIRYRTVLLVSEGEARQVVKNLKEGMREGFFPTLIQIRRALISYRIEKEESLKREDTAENWVNQITCSDREKEIKNNENKTESNENEESENEELENEESESEESESDEGDENDEMENDESKNNKTEREPAMLHKEEKVKENTPTSKNTTKDALHRFSYSRNERRNRRIVIGRKGYYKQKETYIYSWIDELLKQYFKNSNNRVDVKLLKRNYTYHQKKKKKKKKKNKKKKFIKIIN